MRSELFFSQATLALSGTEAGVPRGATRPYLVHQLVADAFGQYRRRPFLYRAEERDLPAQDVLLLSSRRPLPEEQHPERSFGRLHSIRTKPYSLDLPEGTQLDYEIRLNATKDVPRDGKRSRRTDVWEAVWQDEPATGLSPEQVYGAYLQRKLTGTADVLSAAVTERGFIRARKGLKAPTIGFVAANLIGSLRVLDPAGLQELIERGIGRSKAFGCGLLCLSRPGLVLPRRYPREATRSRT